MKQVRLPSGGVLTYLERYDWDQRTRPRLGHVVKTAQFRFMTLHHTVMLWEDQAPADPTSELAHMRALQTVRPDLGLDVPYSFVVFPQKSLFDVTIAEGRGFERTGAHTAGHNSKCWGVALAGDFSNRPMSVGMIEGIRWIGSHITGDPEPTRGHKDFKATACPGLPYQQLAKLQPPFNISEVVMDEATRLRLEEVEATLFLMADPQQIVEAAYTRVLGRAPDKVGRDHWVAYLQGGGRVADLLYQFQMSPEAQR